MKTPDVVHLWERAAPSWRLVCSCPGLDSFQLRTESGRPPQKTGMGLQVGQHMGRNSLFGHHIHSFRISNLVEILAVDCCCHHLTQSFSRSKDISSEARGTYFCPDDSTILLGSLDLSTTDYQLFLSYREAVTDALQHCLLGLF